jgi:hypothetical protein
VSDGARCLRTLEGIVDITCSRTCAIDPHFQMGMIMIGAIPKYKCGLQYLVWDCNILLYNKSCSIVGC